MPAARAATAALLAAVAAPGSPGVAVQVATPSTPAGPATPAAAGRGAGWLAALQRGATARRSKGAGSRPIGDARLARIRSVACLKAKQRDPQAVCSEDGGPPPPAGLAVAASGEAEAAKAPSEAAAAAPGDISRRRLGVGNFPNWQSPRCHSGGELLCDPGGLLEADEQLDVARELRRFREETTVMCGLMNSVLAGDDRTHRRHFNLGVAIVDDWPESWTDPVTLQHFGLVLMGQWGLMPVYNGVDARNGVTEELARRPFAPRCPNVAMLVLVPGHRAAFLSSPSCEFICQERGGSEVARAAVAALAAGGPAAAAKAAVAEVRRLLDGVTPLDLEAHDRASESRAWRRQWADKLWRNEHTWVVAQRLVLLSVAGGLAFALCAFAAYNLAPEPRKSAHGRAVES